MPEPSADSPSSALKPSSSASPSASASASACAPAPAPPARNGLVLPGRASLDTLQASPAPPLALANPRRVFARRSASSGENPPGLSLINRRTAAAGSGRGLASRREVPGLNRPGRGPGGFKLDMGALQRSRGERDFAREAQEAQARRDKFAFFEKDCSRVLEHVYVGSDFVARSREVLKEAGITHVLNCVGFVCPEYFPEEINYKTLWLQDNTGEDLVCALYDVFDYIEEDNTGEDLVCVLYDVFDYIEAVREGDCQHCTPRTSPFPLSGQHGRGPGGTSLGNVFERVKALRAVANPNMGFTFMRPSTALNPLPPLPTLLPSPTGHSLWTRVQESEGAESRGQPEHGVRLPAAAAPAATALNPLPPSPPHRAFPLDTRSRVKALRAVANPNMGFACQVLLLLLPRLSTPSHPPLPTGHSLWRRAQESEGAESRGQPEHGGIPFGDALKRVKALRAVANPNMGFACQLLLPPLSTPSHSPLPTGHSLWRRAQESEGAESRGQPEHGGIPFGDALKRVKALRAVANPNMGFACQLLLLLLPPLSTPSHPPLPTGHSLWRRAQESEGAESRGQPEHGVRLPAAAATALNPLPPSPPHRAFPLETRAQESEGAESGGQPEHGGIPFGDALKRVKALRAVANPNMGFACQLLLLLLPPLSTPSHPPLPTGHSLWTRAQESEGAESRCQPEHGVRLPAAAAPPATALNPLPTTRHLGTSLGNVFERVKALRAVANPNMGFTIMRPSTALNPLPPLPTLLPSPTGHSLWTRVQESEGAESRGQPEHGVRLPAAAAPAATALNPLPPSPPHRAFPLDTRSRVKALRAVANPNMGFACQVLLLLLPRLSTPSHPPLPTGHSLWRRAQESEGAESRGQPEHGGIPFGDALKRVKALRAVANPNMGFACQLLLLLLPPLSTPSHPPLPTGHSLWRRAQESEGAESRGQPEHGGIPFGDALKRVKALRAMANPNMGFACQLLLLLLPPLSTPSHPPLPTGHSLWRRAQESEGAESRGQPKHGGIPFGDAFKRLKALRAVANPNMGFACQLLLLLLPPLSTPSHPPLPTGHSLWRRVQESEGAESRGQPKHGGIPFGDAFKRLKALRAVANPNMGFACQLLLLLLPPLSTPSHPPLPTGHSLWRRAQESEGAESRGQPKHGGIPFGDVLKRVKALRAVANPNMGFACQLLLLLLPPLSTPSHPPLPTGHSLWRRAQESEGAESRGQPEHGGIPFGDAFKRVKALRAVANPNMGFACQLLQWQTRILPASALDPPPTPQPSARPPAAPAPDASDASAASATCGAGGAAEAEAAAAAAAAASGGKLLAARATGGGDDTAGQGAAAAAAALHVPQQPAQPSVAEPALTSGAAMESGVAEASGAAGSCHMYRMAPHSPYDALHLVPKITALSRHSLDPRGAFIVQIRTKVYCWRGRECYPLMAKQALAAAAQIIKYERLGEVASAGWEVASAGGEVASAGREVASAGGGEVVSAGGEVAFGEGGSCEQGLQQP
ncbi:unnamed protein product [Closterium sp. Naga37s-1]|nr:unnamed protein product [Closterium sp. Naga37s-1]